MSVHLPSDETLRGIESEKASVLRVEAVFRVADEQSAQTVAAKMIDRAHEIANLPECECDVDVSVEWASPDVPADPGGVPAGGEPPASGRSPER